MPRNRNLPDPEKIVKCACGLPMRQRNWRDHWYTCYTCSPVEATQLDIDNLLAYEQRRANRDDAREKAGQDERD